MSKQAKGKAATRAGWMRVHRTTGASVFLGEVSATVYWYDPGDPQNDDYRTIPVLVTVRDAKPKRRGSK